MRLLLCALLFTPLTAQAQNLQEMTVACETAIQHDDAKKSSEATAALKSWHGSADAKTIQRAQNCLTRFDGKYWFYSEATESFTTGGGNPSPITDLEVAKKLAEKCMEAQSKKDDGTVSEIARNLKAWSGELPSDVAFEIQNCLISSDGKYWYYSKEDGRFVNNTNHVTPPQPITKTAPEVDLQSALNNVYIGNASDFDLINAVIEAPKGTKIDNELRSELISEIHSYVKPLAATRRQLNLMAYQALHRLSPEDAAFSKKADYYAASMEKHHNAILKSLRKSHDQYTNWDWYSHPDTPRYADTRPYIAFVLGQKGSGKQLNFIAHYTASNWLFVNKVKARIDGKEVTLPLGKFQRDNGSGAIWEWSEASATSEILDIARQIAASKKTVLRFEGDRFVSDFIVPESDKIALLDMIWLKNYDGSLR